MDSETLKKIIEPRTSPDLTVKKFKEKIQQEKEFQKRRIMRVDDPAPWNELRVRTENHWKNNGHEFKLFVSPHTEVAGINLGVLGKHKIDFEVARVYKYKVERELENGKKERITIRNLVMFDKFKNFARRYHETPGEIIPVYKYQFNGEDKHKYYILFDQKIPAGECIISGNVIFIPAKKQNSDGYIDNIYVRYLIPHTIKPRYKYWTSKDAEKFFGETSLERVKQHVFNIFRHHTPVESFETLIMAILLSGKEDGYPLHLLWVGPTDSGQSTFQDQLNYILMEREPPTSSGTSTLKGLTVSHREKPPTPGYLARCQRVGNVDEFFDIINKSHSVLSGNTQQLLEQLGPLKDVLEQRSRTSESGNGSIELNFKSKVIFTTNPCLGNKDMMCISDLTEQGNLPFLSRVGVIYFQRSQHTDMIKNQKKSKEEKIKQPLDKYTFLGFYDWCQLNTIDFRDKQTNTKIKEVIHETAIQISFDIGPDAKQFFREREPHRSRLLLDGIVKQRCLAEKKLNLTPQDCDYEVLKETLRFMVERWKMPANYFANLDENV